MNLARRWELLMVHKQKKSFVFGSATDFWSRRKFNLEDCQLTVVMKQGQTTPWSRSKESLGVPHTDIFKGFIIIIHTYIQLSIIMKRKILKISILSSRTMLLHQNSSLHSHSISVTLFISATGYFLYHWCVTDLIFHCKHNCSLRTT